MQKIVFIVLVACFLINNQSIAQSGTLLQEAEEKTISIADSENAPNTQVLELVKRTKEKNNIEIEVKEHRSIIRKNNKVQASLALGNYVLRGDFTYLEFNIKPLLNPDLVSYTYQWKDANGKTISEETVVGKKFKSGANLVKIDKSYSNLSENSSISFTNIAFNYSKSSAEKLLNFTKTVDSYYNADARLNMINQALDKVKLDTLELLEDYHQQTLNNIKAFNSIKGERYTSKLNLNAKDPILLKSNLGQSIERNKKLKKELEFTLKNMHIAYYKKGKDWIRWNDTKQAKSLFLKSINEKQNYAPANYELALLLFNDGNFQEAYDSLAQIISTMNPDNDTRYNSIKLAEKIIYGWLDKVYLFMDEGKPDLAYKELDRIIAERERIEGVKVFKEFTEIKEKLFQEYYAQMAKNIEQSIADKKLKEAQLQLDSLISYREMNKDYYIGTQEETKLYQLLYTAWVEKGKVYMDKNTTDSAIYALTHAKIICSTKDEILCTEDLFATLKQARENYYEYMILSAKKLVQDELADSAIVVLATAKTYSQQNNIEPLQGVEELYLKALQLKYNQLIHVGQEALEQQKSREALAYLQEAVDMETNGSLIVNPALKELVNAAAVAYALELCSESESLIASTLLLEGKSKYNRALGIKNQYKLTNKELDTRLALVAAKLNDGECEKLKHKYAIQLEASKIFISRKDFANANNALNKAHLISKDNPDCAFNDSLIKEEQNSIQPILNYQEQIFRVEKNISEDNFKKAIELYSFAQKYYHDSITNHYGIKTEALFDFIFNHENSQLLDNAIPYYLNLGDNETALKLLNELYRREYISSWSKESQIKLGKALAKIDYEQENSANPKNKVLEYTKGIKWYNSLKKAYLSEWKNLI